MADGITISIQLDTRALDKMTSQMERKAERILDVAANHIEQRAMASMVGGGTPHQPSAPGSPPAVDTGTLKNSIPESRKTERLCRWVGTNLPYGLYLEFGTSRIAARPWLTPAIEAERGAVESAWAQLFEL